MEDETFFVESWQALLTGLGMVPDMVPPAVDRISLSRLNGEFGRILGFIKAKVLEQPAHDSYLRTLLQGAVA
jgi:hypothetical protein